MSPRRSEFLSETDAMLLRHTFNTLAVSGFDTFAITGSLALGILMAEEHRTPTRHTINDLDVVARSFDDLPSSLTDRFRCIHVHPDAPPGKLLLQLVDPLAPLRVDVFRSRGRTMERTKTSVCAPAAMVSLEDIAVLSTARLMSLKRGCPVPPKHYEDFLALIDMVDCEVAEQAWADHRGVGDPVNFSEAINEVRHLTAIHGHLLCPAKYSQDANTTCPKCKILGAFAPATAQEVIKILGYC
jgi:hypothetical protein